MDLGAILQGGHGAVIRGALHFGVDRLQPGAELIVPAVDIDDLALGGCGAARTGRAAVLPEAAVELPPQAASRPVVPTAPMPFRKERRLIARDVLLLMVYVPPLGVRYPGLAARTCL